jgi:hypothetical protein
MHLTTSETFLSRLSRVGLDREELMSPIDEVPELVAVLLAALFALGGVRWLLGRGSQQDPGAGSQMESTASREEDAAPAGPAVAFMLPASLPLSAGVRRVTHNEIHAVELGLVVGVVTIWLSGRNGTAGVALLVAFVSGTLGFRRYCSPAFHTTRREPWYALVALVVGGTLTMLAA